MIRTTAFALAACATLALGCNREQPDMKVNTAVLAKLDQEPSLNGGVVQARTEAGHVYLSGRVMTPEQRRRAEDLADDVKGVKEVTNDIQVDVASGPPASPPASANPPIEPNPSMPEANPPMPETNPTPPPGPDNETPPPAPGDRAEDSQ